MMECCGKPMTQTGASSTPIGKGIYRTERYYKCSKCGKTYTETLEPIEV